MSLSLRELAQVSTLHYRLFGNFLSKTLNLESRGHNFVQSISRVILFINQTLFLLEFEVSITLHFMIRFAEIRFFQEIIPESFDCSFWKVLLGIGLVLSYGMDIKTRNL